MPWHMSVPSHFCAMAHFYCHSRRVDRMVKKLVGFSETDKFRSFLKPNTAFYGNMLTSRKGVFGPIWIFIHLSIHKRGIY